MTSRPEFPLGLAGMDWQVQACRRSLAATGEWLEFLSRRLKKDAEIAERMAHCRGPGEVMQACVEFWSQAAIDYQRELVTLMQIGSAVATVADGGERQRQGAGHDRMPLAA